MCRRRYFGATTGRGWTEARLPERTESRETRAEVCRVEIRALQAELRRQGGRKVGGWLRRSSVTAEDAGGGDVADNVH
jgi:hypothetical protein